MGNVTAQRVWSHNNADAKVPHTPAQSCDAPVVPHTAEKQASASGRSELLSNDESETGMLSIMNIMFKAQRYEKKGRETEGFKLAVLQWSSAYGVAYSLMMTIAFGMLITRPLPAQQPSADAPFTLKDWRPRSDYYI